MTTLVTAAKETSLLGNPKCLRNGKYYFIDIKVTRTGIALCH